MLWPQFWEYQSVLIQSLLEWMMMKMMTMQWWNADLHGKGVQGDRDWSILSQPSSNFCEMWQSSSKLFTEQIHLPAKNKTKQQPFTELWLPPASAQHTHPSRLWAAPRRSWCRRPPCWCWSRSYACGRCRSSRSLTPDHLGKHRKWKQRWMELECRFGSAEVRRCFSWTDNRVFFFLFFIIWTSLLTELLYGFIGIWRQPSFARLIESVAVDELWRNKSIESNHMFVSICSCEQRWVCWGEQLPRCFITLFRQGQQRSIFQKPLSLDVACHREGPARPTHALQDTNTE